MSQRAFADSGRQRDLFLGCGQRAHRRYGARDDIPCQTNQRSDRIARQTEYNLTRRTNTEPHGHTRALRDVVENFSYPEVFQYLGDQVEFSL